MWVLENKVYDILERLKEASQQVDIVLLDYETNCDVLNPQKPLSHAYLVKAFVENNYPKEADLYKELIGRKNKPFEKGPPKEVKKKKTSNAKKTNDNIQTTLF